VNNPANRGGRSPRFLVLLYDESCPLCRRLKAILATRRPLVPVHLVPVGSAQAQQLFPTLDLDRARNVLTVIDDAGALYESDAAWLVCLWAIPGLRPAANHFARGWRRGVFRTATDVVDAVRQIGRKPGSAYPGLDVAGQETVKAFDRKRHECDGESCPAGLPEWLGDNSTEPGPADPNRWRA
jgi:predicted DCC family thiol-disulfide oxidoreductase YuxK